MIAIYRSKDEWVLGYCNECRRLNYVEPHGTSADCKHCKRSTEHTNIPYKYRDMSGCNYRGRRTDKILS